MQAELDSCVQVGQAACSASEAYVICCDFHIKLLDMFVSALIQWFTVGPRPQVKSAKQGWRQFPRRYGLHWRDFRIALP